MKEKINTVLFDLDGTLVDTNELIVQSFLHTLGLYYPGRYTREDIPPFMGPTLHETFGGIDPEKVEELIEVYRKFNYEQHDLLVKEFDGVFETVQNLHQNGFKLAIVSTKIRSVVIKGLELTNLAQFFDVVITLDEVENPKPDPEPLLKALDLLGSRPEEAVMVGDSMHDILGGKNASTYTCGVAWSLKGRDYLDTFEPDFMLEKMADLLDIVGHGQK